MSEDGFSNIATYREDDFMNLWPLATTKPNQMNGTAVMIGLKSRGVRSLPGLDPISLDDVTALLAECVFGYVIQHPNRWTNPTRQLSLTTWTRRVGRRRCSQDSVPQHMFELYELYQGMV